MAEQFMYVTRRPISSLVLLFILWKGLLLTIAFLAPGPGYDTSTSILLYDPSRKISPVDRLVVRLVRWDAIYFVKLAERGHAWEQEWAFSWGLTRAVHFLSKYVSLWSIPSARSVALVGIGVSHLTHLLAVLTLYALVSRLIRFGSLPNLAFLSSALHIVSPAGLFLSAPCGESPFALFNFIGTFFYIAAIGADAHDQMAGYHTDICMMAAGLSFGIATLIRSNGLFSGLLFVLYCFTIVRSALSRGWNISHIRRLFTTGIAGILTGLGLIIPQVIAYQQYCGQTFEGSKRPWCDSTFPSIYTYVQDRYWHNGFLRYWTLSNAPLFVIAAPTIYLLIKVNFKPLYESASSYTSQQAVSVQSFQKRCLQHLAVPQVVLACLSVTNFHVQIINRVSSGYPLWYIMVASYLCLPQKKKQNHLFVSPTVVVRYMVMYAMIQGILYASFLPPA